MSKIPVEVANAAMRELADKGYFTDFLDDQQKKWVHDFRTIPGDHVWKIGRQRGKTFAAVSEVFETMATNAHWIGKYCAKTKDSAAEILVPTFEQILKPMTPSLRPQVKDNTVIFRNGSILKWAGTDALSFDKLRGPFCHRIALDEAAFYQKLKEVESALLPQLITTRSVGGKALYLSTPPLSKKHPFVSRFLAAKAKGRAQEGTIYDNPRLSEEDILVVLDAFAENQGMTREEARASTVWRREYMGEIVTEVSRVALPAWTEDIAKRCTVERERPQYFDGYSALDTGFDDGFGLLFGYWDFARQVLVIEAEYKAQRVTTATMIREAKRIENELWGVEGWNGTLRGAKDLYAGMEKVPPWIADRINADAPKQPYLRCADATKLGLADISSEYGVAYIPAEKHEKHLAVDFLNIAIARGQVEVHPRCKELLVQMESVIWNEARTEWERDEHGHGELIDALVYMWRRVDKHRDPRPDTRDEMWRVLDATQDALIGDILRGRR